MLAEVEFNVTNEDISDGFREKCDCCPVALSINRKVIDGLVAIVLRNEFAVRAHHGIPPYRHRLPGDVSDFTERFDIGLECRPLSFVIRDDREELEKAFRPEFIKDVPQ